MSEPGSCWLCHRPLGRRVERHHLVPKARGGRETALLHPVCHRALHRHFDHARLQRIGTDRGALLEHPDLARFLAFLEGKPPDFHVPTRAPSRRR